MKVLVLKQDEHQAAGLAPPSYFDALTEVASKFPHAEETPDPLLVARATLAAVTRSLLGCWTLAAALRNASGSLPASDLREIAGSAMEGATLLFELPSLLNEEAALLADLCNCVASPTADGVVDALRANQQRADLTQITFAALRLADIHRLSRR
ncbi:MAG TPA: hypothetical protein VEB65_04910, partial [Solirubrobacterales bacterium]|nr:hypothetical protein [Solirubrobacterales bacterium]